MSPTPTSGARGGKRAPAWRSLFNDFLAMPWEMLMPPGYTSLSSMKNTMKHAQGAGRAQAPLARGADGRAAPWWSAARRRCATSSSRLRDATGANHLVTMLQFGVLNDELTRRNMELFAADVMPHLRG